MSSALPRVISTDIRSMLPTDDGAGDVEPHPRAAAGSRAGLDRAAVRFDQSFRDGKAETRAAAVGRSDEAVEDVRELVRGDTGTGVVDDEARAGALAVRRDGDGHGATGGGGARC